MSEHRYGVHDCPNGFYYLRDVTDHSVYVHRNYGKLFSEYKEDIELVSSLLNELADKVDEQQVTINKLKEENEQLKEQVQILNECCRFKSSDEAIKQAYADLNRREREKHSQGNVTYTAKINQNEVIY